MINRYRIQMLEREICCPGGHILQKIARCSSADVR